MKIGVFTPLLSALPLDEVLKKLKSLGIDMVEFGTGNYPGDAHAQLSHAGQSRRAARPSRARSPMPG